MTTPDQKDEEVFAQLVKLSQAPEQGRSAHWEQMLQAYSVTDQTFSGLNGFGRHLPRSAPSALANFIMQTPFRRMGSRFPRFNMIHTLGRGLARRQNRLFDLDILRQVLTASLIDQHLDLARLPGPVLVIGDGFGALTALMLALLPGKSVMLINLAPVLLVDLVYARRVMPEVGLHLVDSREQLDAALIDKRQSIIALRADSQELLGHAPVSLALNVASMQEMHPEIIENYFHVLRACPTNETYIYCANRLRKTLPDGTVTEFQAYPWRAEDQVLLDGLCPWHQRYYTIIPPKYRPYDGPIQHRLAKLGKNADG